MSFDWRINLLFFVGIQWIRDEIRACFKRWHFNLFFLYTGSVVGVIIFFIWLNTIVMVIRSSGRFFCIIWLVFSYTVIIMLSLAGMNPSFNLLLFLLLEDMLLAGRGNWTFQSCTRWRDRRWVNLPNKRVFLLWFFGRIVGRGYLCRGRTSSLSN